jgi:hypothetical protein
VAHLPTIWWWSPLGSACTRKAIEDRRPAVMFWSSPGNKHVPSSRWIDQLLHACSHHRDRSNYLRTIVLVLFKNTVQASRGCFRCTSSLLLPPSRCAQYQVPDLADTATCNAKPHHVVAIHCMHISNARTATMPARLAAQDTWFIW